MTGHTEIREALLAARGCIAADRGALFASHVHPSTGNLDLLGKEGVAEYDAILDKIEAALADLDTLRQRAEKAEEDARRLDALEASVVRDGWIVAKNVGSFTVSLGRPTLASRSQHATRATLREAIDAARSATGPQGGTP